MFSQFIGERTFIFSLVYSKQVILKLLESICSFYGWWINWNFKLNFESNVAISGEEAECIGAKQDPYWDFVEVDNFICPILHNQINLGNNVFHNLLIYGNEYIEKISVDEDKARNFLLLIDSSIDEKFNIRDEFDVSNEGKELYSLKNVRRNSQTTITNMINEILNRDFRKDELNKKREVFKRNFKGWEKI